MINWRSQQKKSYNYFTDQDDKQLNLQNTQNIYNNFPKENNQNKQNNNHYISKMKDINIPSNIQLLEKLSLYKIKHHQDIICQQFRKSCIKTDWQSIKYIARIGNIQGQLTVLRINLSHTMFNHCKIGNGKYGTIYKHGINGINYAVKNIKISQKQNNIDTALKELFLAKIASTLQIGPKFISFYGYCAIIFIDGLQFSMEVCQTQYSTFMKYEKQVQNDLLVSLKILHSLQICDIDIKFDNVAWSPSFGKFVYIDYGFSKFVKEPIGQKSKTKFIGTFSYASPQMKKLYFLKSHGYIDLYFNDLYCLQRVIKYLVSHKNEQDLLLITKYIFERPSQNNQVLNVNGEKSIALNSFIKFKYYFFIEDYKSINELIFTKQSLDFTYKNLLKSHLKKLQNYENKQIVSLLQLTDKKQKTQEKINDMDAIFLDYTLTLQSQQILISQCYKFKEIINQQDNKLFLSTYWLKQQQMPNVFYFLDVYSNLSKDLEKDRKKLINKIYFIISNSLLNAYDTLKFHTVLVYFFNYFAEKENLQILVQIQSYFVLLDDFPMQDQMEVQILKLYKKRFRKDIKEYVLKNLEYFFGKIINVSNYSYLQLSNNYKNLQNLLQENIDNEANEQFIKDTIKFMKQIQLKIRFFNFQITFKLITEFSKFESQYFCKYEKIFNQDIINFAQYSINWKKRKNYQVVLSQLIQPTFRSQYLKNCIHKCKLFFYHKMSQNKHVYHIITNQLFLSQFNTVFSLFLANLPENCKIQIYSDYKIITKQNIFNLSHPIQEQLIKYQKPIDICKLVLTDIENFKFDLITNIEKILISADHFYKMLLVMLAFRHLTSNKKLQWQRTIDSIANFFFLISLILKQPDMTYDYTCIGPFNNYTQSLALDCKLPSNLQKIYNYLRQNKILTNSNTFPQLMNQLHCIYIMGFILINWLKDNPIQAIRNLIDFSQNFSQINSIIFLSDIYNQIQESDKKRAENILFKFVTVHIENNRFNLLIKVKKSIFIAINRYRQTYGLGQSIELFMNLSKYLLQQKSKPTISGYFQALIIFVNSCNVQQANQVLQQYFFNNNLSSLSSYHFVMVLFFYLYIKVKQKLSIRDKYKIIKACVFFVHYLKQGFFKTYKQSLRYESQLLKEKKRNRKRIDKNAILEMKKNFHKRNASHQMQMIVNKIQKVRSINKKDD